MTDNESALMEGIEKIANSEQVKNACEPNCLYHSKISSGEILRVLYAQKLLLEENEKVTQ